MDNIKYIALPNAEINIKQIHDARKIVDDAFAAGYFTNHLNEINCAWVALDGDKVVGWAAVCIDDFYPLTCVLRCIVVHPDYRGKGIGKRLTEERLKYLTKQGCSIVFSYAWIRPNGDCMSCKNLENFGFRLVEQLHDYYSETRSVCKYCSGNCNCIARLYVKSLV